MLGAGIASGLGFFLRGAGRAVAEGRIRVSTRAFVSRVRHADRDVMGVAARADDGSPIELAARSVVLAAGCIESIRLAVLSEVPDRSGLIGVGVQEHHFWDCWYEGSDFYDEADTAIVYVPSESQSSEQWELHAPGRTLFTIDDGRPWQPDASDRYQVMVRSFCATDKAAGNTVSVEDGPRGSSVLSWRTTAEDERRRAATLESATRFQEALGLRPVDDLADAVRFRGPGASYHEAGGLDMGMDPMTSVTHPDGHFHGLPALLCVDAAALPCIGATNPHLTLVALARRKALALAARLES